MDFWAATSQNSRRIVIKAMPTCLKFKKHKKINMFILNINDYKIIYKMYFQY